MSDKSIEIIITRDSVCLADDINPPHIEIIHFDSSESTRNLIKKISNNYLPKISGFGHKWEFYLNDELIGTTSFFRRKVEVSKLEYLEKNYVYCKYIISI